MNAQKGFTLIELMIVVAIIGILAAIAIPAYQNYTKRAHVSEGLELAGAAKTGVTEFYSSNGHFPLNNASAGISSTITGNAVTGVALGSGTGLITITYNDKVTSNATLLLSPVASTGAVTWKCKAGTNMDSKYLPSNCR